MSKLKLLFTRPTLGVTTVSPFYFLVKGRDYINTLGGGERDKKIDLIQITNKTRKKQKSISREQISKESEEKINQTVYQLSSDSKKMKKQNS